ncbi:MAG: hypothetical protein OER12_10875, partial [Acidimicrobiia bacterium]|nr:hypothetical protein [Acidimicrobiia bacterium]
MHMEFHTVEIPLRGLYQAAGHTVAIRRAIIVKAADDNLAGWGEFVEIPGYSRETVETAFAWMSGSPVTNVNPGAIAAVSAAQLDVQAKREGVPLTTLLGGTPGRVTAGAVVGRFGDTDGALQEAGDRVAEGYQKIKLKIGPGFDVEPLTAIRRAFPTVQLAADANGSYTPGEIPDGLDQLELLYLEQPYSPHTPWPEFADLRERLETPVGLDESITGLTTLRSAIAANACDVVTLKPANYAGLRNAVSMHEVAMAGGLQLVAGGMLESGIGRGAAAAFARLPGFTLPADLSAS